MKVMKPMSMLTKELRDVADALERNGDNDSAALVREGADRIAYEVQLKRQHLTAKRYAVDLLQRAVDALRRSWEPPTDDKEE